MPSQQWRIRILCEDHRSERFLLRLCERYSVTVLSVLVAPSGRGDASAWVRHVYREEASKRRSKNFQKNLGLLVAIDGDDRGVAARKNQLDTELTDSGLPPRQPEEPVAVFVPTWSIETWLARLCGRLGETETEPLKVKQGVRELWRDGPTEAATIKQAAAAWRGPIPSLPSLSDAYGESERVGLT